MTPIKRRLLYIFRDTLLRLRITWGGGRAVTISVGYHVDKADAKGKPKWDGARCVRNSTHGPDKVPAHVINRVLEQLEERIDSAFLQYESIDAVPSKEQLRQTLSPRKKEAMALGHLCRRYIQEESVRRHWSPRSIRQRKQSLDNVLELFGEDVRLEDIPADGYQRLISHMLNKECYDLYTGRLDEPSKHKGYNNSTINRYVINIRSFINWAIKRGHARSCALLTDDKMLVTVKNPVVYLTPEELERFADIQTTGTWREFQHAFLFCCFTGLRFSDIKQLRWDQIKDDHIEIITQKTHDRLIIDLNSHSKALLEERMGADADCPVFQLPANSEYNRGIKEIARLAGIDEPVQLLSCSGNERKSTVVPKWQYVSSHTPRKTFITNALSMGIPPMIVMKWTGHKTLKAMEPYIDIVTNARKENMTKFDSLLPLRSTRKPTSPSNTRQETPPGILPENDMT